MGPVEQRLREGRTRIIAGWYQGWFWDCTGTKCCATGAIGFGGFTMPGEEHSKYSAGNVLNEVVGGPVDEWNDDPTRKHHHVIAAFGLAIAIAKRRGV